MKSHRLCVVTQYVGGEIDSRGNFSFSIDFRLDILCTYKLLDQENIKKELKGCGWINMSAQDLISMIFDGAEMEFVKRGKF